MCLYVCVRELFSLPNRWTNQDEIGYVVSKYLGKHSLHLGVAMGIVLS